VCCVLIASLFTPLNGHRATLAVVTSFVAEGYSSACSGPHPQRRVQKYSLTKSNSIYRCKSRRLGTHCKPSGRAISLATLRKLPARCVGELQFDHRDHYKAKRIDHTASLMSLRFRQLYRAATKWRCLAVVIMCGLMSPVTSLTSNGGSCTADSHCASGDCRGSICCSSRVTRAKYYSRRRRFSASANKCTACLSTAEASGRRRRYLVTGYFFLQPSFMHALATLKLYAGSLTFRCLLYRLLQDVPLRLLAMVQLLPRCVPGGQALLRPP